MSLVMRPNAIPQLQENLAISYDVALGRDFEHVDVNPDKYAVRLRGRGMDDASIAATSVLVSAEAPQTSLGPLMGELTGDDMQVVVYLGNSLAKAKEVGADKTGGHAILTSMVASSTAAHEGAHRASHARRGSQRLDAEHSRWQRARIMRYSVPEIAYGAAVLIGVGIGEYIAQKNDVSPWLAWPLGALLCAGAGLEIIPNARTKRIRATTGDAAYYKKPEERRARRYQAAYDRALDKDFDNMLVCAVPKGTVSYIRDGLTDRLQGTPARRPERRFLARR